MNDRYGVKHLPVLAEFIIAGMALCLSKILRNGNEVDTFFEIVKKRCVDQGLDENDVESTLSPLSTGIKDSQSNLQPESGQKTENED